MLSAASVQSFTCLKEGLIYHENVDNKDTAENWLEGFGIWAGAKLEEVEIQILPPASQYYSKQIWHDSQEDSWEGEILVRRMNAIISPELVRRVLSLGRFVKSVRPEELVELIRSDLKKLLHNIG